MVSVYRDLPYSEHARCALDLYIPQRRAGAVVLVVHGGAWMIGDKARTESSCRMLAEHGLVAVACNYRLSSIPRGVARQGLWWTTVLGTLVMWLAGVRSRRILLFVGVAFVGWVVYFVGGAIAEDTADDHPTHMDDVRDALTWVQRHIHRYGGNPRCIVLMGHSAGAHLVSLLACKLSRLPDHPVRGVVCISGVYSMERMKEVTLGEWVVRSAFGKMDDYATHSPVLNLHPGVPPHALLNATWDISLIRHTWDMLAAMRAEGCYVQARRFDGDHFTIMRNWRGANAPVWAYIWAFIQQVVAAEGARGSPGHASGHNRSSRIGPVDSRRPRAARADAPAGGPDACKRT